MTIAFKAPAWAENFGADFKATLQEKSAELLTKICIEEQPGEAFFRCVIGRCGTENHPGYALFSPEEAIRHYIKIHNEVMTDEFKSAIYGFYRKVSSRIKREFMASHSNEKKKEALEKYKNKLRSKRVERKKK